MQWWNDFLSWIRTSDGHQAVFTAGVVLLAVVIGTVVIASIFRASLARLIRQQDHERKNSVIATLVDAAVDASAWNALTGPERVLSDRASGQAETHLRLLPVKGSGVAANWVAHELAELKHTSSTGGYQTQASVGEFRDRLVQWRDKPGRARKAFLADLERWRFSETGRDRTTETGAAPSEDGRRSPDTTPAPQPTAAAPVVVGAGVTGAASGSAADRAEQAPTTSAPTIVLPASAGDPSQEETRRLLADVDRLEMPSRERPVEELPPVETPRAAAAPAESAESAKGRADDAPVTAVAAPLSESDADGHETAGLDNETRFEQDGHREGRTDG